MDRDAAIVRAQLEQMVTIFDDGHERHGFLVELVAAGLDARQIEDLVDQAEQMHAGIVDVGGSIPYRPAPHGAEYFGLHHFGKAEDGIERRAQLVTHLRQETRFGDVGGFRAAACLVGNRLGLLELADQRVLFRARFQRRKRGRIKPIGEHREVALRGQRHEGENVVVAESLAG